MCQMNHAMKKSIFFLLLNMLAFSLVGQQIPSLGQYYVNPYLLNPAFTGKKDQAELFVHYRKQWVGLPGAPETQLITLDGPLGQEKLGLGLMLYNNVFNIIGKTGGMLSASYEVRFNERQRMGFGLSLGFMQNKIYFDRIRARDPFEQSILNNLEQKTLLDANFGIRYENGNFTLGLASHQLAANDVDFENEQDNKSTVYSLVRHYTATVGYRLSLSGNDYEERFSLEPLLMLRSAEGLPPQIDLNTIIHYKDKAWFALTYKYQVGGALGTGIVLDDRFSVGYTYEFATTEFRNAHDNSHEISLSYRFGQFQGSLNGKASRSISKDIELEELKKKNALLFDEIAENSLKDGVSGDTLFIDLTAGSTRKKYKIGEIADRKNGYYIVVGSYSSLREAISFQRVIYRYMPNTRIIRSEPTENGNTFFFVCAEYLTTKKAAQRALFKVNRDKIKIEEYIDGYPWIYIINNDSK